MTSPPRRRPLPALIFLVALTLLTALVWWRVLSRDDSHAAETGECPTPHTTVSAPASPSTHELPRPADVHLAVLNSTHRTNLAAHTAERLRNLGFAVDKVANDVGNPVIKGKAHIRYLPSAKASAVLLSYYLPGAKLVRVTPNATTADTPALAVSLGKKFHKPATAADALHRMRADGRSMAKTAAPSTGTSTSTSADCAS